jgi:hypothetical protein
MIHMPEQEGQLKEGRRDAFWIARRARKQPWPHSHLLAGPPSQAAARSNVFGPEVATGIAAAAARVRAASPQAAAAMAPALGALRAGLGRVPVVKGFQRDGAATGPARGGGDGGDTENNGGGTAEGEE